MRISKWLARRGIIRPSVPRFGLEGGSNVTENWLLGGRFLSCPLPFPPARLQAPDEPSPEPPPTTPADAESPPPPGGEVTSLLLTTLGLLVLLGAPTITGFICLLLTGLLIGAVSKDPLLLPLDSADTELVVEGEACPFCSNGIESATPFTAEKNTEIKIQQQRRTKTKYEKNTIRLNRSGKKVSRGVIAAAIII